MKLLMVIPTYAPVVGGAERQLEGIAPTLAALGHRVTVLTRRLPATVAREQSDDCEIRRLPTFGLRLGFHLSLFFYLLFRLRRYDVVHCHTLSGPALVCALGAALARRPLVLKVTRSGPGSQIRQWRRSGLSRWAFRRIEAWTARFVAISADCSEELAEAGVAPRKWAPIPNGVEIPLASRRARPDPTIVCTGRLIRRKRVDLLLTAFAAVAKDTDARLSIIGDGPYRDDLGRLATELGVDGRVDFHGELGRRQVEMHLSGADIFAFPSESEGMSNSLLEAMAFGLPILARDIPANRELLEDERSALLFSTEDGFADALGRVLSDPDLRARLGAAARTAAEERYSFGAVARAYDALYRELEPAR